MAICIDSLLTNTRLARALDVSTLLWEMSYRCLPPHTPEPEQRRRDGKCEQVNAEQRCNAAHDLSWLVDLLTLLSHELTARKSATGLQLNELTPSVGGWDTSMSLS